MEHRAQPKASPSPGNHRTSAFAPTSRQPTLGLAGWRVQCSEGSPIAVWAAEAAAPIPDCIAQLRRHGVVLLRRGRFELDAFEALTAKFCDEFRDVGLRAAVPRGDGQSTYVFADNLVMLPHTEQSYKPYPPPHLCFFQCVKPPALAGGETTLLDGTTLLASLEPELRDRFDRLGIIYEMTWAPERWRREFYVRTTGELRTYLDRQPGVEYRVAGERLTMRYRTAAVTRSILSLQPALATNLLSHLPELTHPQYRALKTYCNPTNRVYFGDGSPIGADVVDALLEHYSCRARPLIGTCRQTQAWRSREEPSSCCRCTTQMHPTPPKKHPVRRPSPRTSTSARRSRSNR